MPDKFEYIRRIYVNGREVIQADALTGANHVLSVNGVSHYREFFAELSRLLQQVHNNAAENDSQKKCVCHLRVDQIPSSILH
jgi:hypothetical protein